MEELPAILKKLCSHLTGITDEASLSEQYRVSVAVLRTGLWSGPCGSNQDAALVGDKIKKWLMRQDRLHHALQFSQLLNNLMNSNNGVACESSSASNEFFTLPPLHLGSTVLGPPRSSSESSKTSGSKEALPQPGAEARLDPSGSRRVAKLAAAARGTAKSTKEVSNVETKGSPKLLQQQLFRRHQPPPVEVTEEILVREVLFILQGIEGKIIKLDSASEGYKIDSQVRISKPTRDLILKLAEVGWLYSQVQKFCQTQQHRSMCKSASAGHISGLASGNKLSQSISHYTLSQLDVSTGLSSGPALVNQALVLALKDHLNEHCRLIAVLEAQLTGTDSEGNGGLTLRRLLLWTLEPRLRLRALLHLTDSARGLWGGALLSALYEHLQHGSPSNKTVVQHCLSRAAAPLHAMLTQWLVHGTLTDPHHEFFIAADTTVSDHNLWHHKYSMRWSMVPSFLSKEQARLVLATGKSLNFLRSVCKLKAPMDGQEAIVAALKNTTVESLFLAENRSALDALIGVTYRLAAGRVLQEVLEQQQLLQHITALRRYLLLGQGDFIHALMQVLRDELCQPATRLYPHNLSSLLETAVAASNARYDHPDTLRRLDVKLLEVAHGDTGWDVFSLDYHVDGPIGTVLTAECMQQYLMLFNSLWRAKHMECLLSDTWKQQAATSKLCRQLPEVYGVVHGVQLLLSEMIHLVHQLGYYMTFEVLEVSWHTLMSAMKAPQSLDQLIAAHNGFLARIVKGALLDSLSADVRMHLRSLYGLMLRLEELQRRLHAGVTAEISARHSKLLREQEREKAGQFSTTEAEEAAEQQRKLEFSSRFIVNLRTELKILTQTYQDMVQSLLLMLATHSDDSLQQLSSRLDFNEHYQRRDMRLRQRLSFHHKRKSMGGKLVQNAQSSIQM